MSGAVNFLVYICLQRHQPRRAYLREIDESAVGGLGDHGVSVGVDVTLHYSSGDAPPTVL